MRKRLTSGSRRRYRSSRTSMLALRICMWGCVVPASAHTDAGPAPAYVPARYDVVTGAANRQTVLTGFLSGGSVADLAAVDVDVNGGRRLRVFSFVDGGWDQGVEATLRPDVSFVDVANINGLDRLIAYGAGRLSWFDPEAAAERELAVVISDFGGTSRAEVLHVDITRDLNGDGRDDLVIPHGRGFQVLVQLSGGAFAEALKIGPEGGLDRVYAADGYRHQPWVQGGRFHEVDVDLDGRTDLVFWNQDRFQAHLQDEHGLFSSRARTFTTEVTFDSDDPAFLAAPQEVRRRRLDHQLTGAKQGSVLHSLTDMNGDGVADLVVFSLTIRSMWSVHSAYEVYLGAPTPDGGIVFASEAGSAIRSDGLPFVLGPHDFDGDGQVDMMFTTMKFGFFKTMGMVGRGMLTRSVRMHLEFYRMKGGVYPDEPNATRRVKGRAPGVSGQKSIFHPSVLIGDVNGDSRSDLLVQQGPEELRVYLGVQGPALFTRRPEKLTVPMPNEEYTWLVDLNRDGKQDVLMHHPSTTEPHRVTMLISR